MADSLDLLHHSLNAQADHCPESFGEERQIDTETGRKEMERNDFNHRACESKLTGDCHTLSIHLQKETIYPPRRGPRRPPWSLRGITGLRDI